MMDDQNLFYVTKIHVVTGVTSKSVYIKVLWKPNQIYLFDIEIFHDQCWFGSFSYESAKIESTRLDETEEQYINNIKNCLLKENHMYKYEIISTSEGTAKFMWKRRFENSTAVMLHGTVEIKLSIDQDKDSLITYLLHRNETLEKKLEECKKSNEILNNELETYKTQFEKLIDMKSSLESTLYGKFVEILNAKKRRIQLLEDNLEIKD